MLDAVSLRRNGGQHNRVLISCDKLFILVLPDTVNDEAHARNRATYFAVRSTGHGFGGIVGKVVIFDVTIFVLTVSVRYGHHLLISGESTVEFFESHCKRTKIAHEMSKRTGAEVLSGCLEHRAVCKHNARDPNPAVGEAAREEIVRGV